MAFAVAPVVANAGSARNSERRPSGRAMRHRAWNSAELNADAISVRPWLTNGIFYTKHLSSQQSKDSRQSL